MMDWTQCDEQLIHGSRIFCCTHIGGQDHDGWHVFTLESQDVKLINEKLRKAELLLNDGVWK